jgi:hypothetical protein
MSAGLHPADSLNHLNRDSGIPLDSIGTADALGFLGVVPEATGRPAYHPGDRGMFRRSERQRCLAHRMRNLAAKAPNDL